LLERYFKQLYIYANILKERYGTYPQKLYIYWTSKPDRDQALMEVPFNNNDAVGAGDYFDGIVNTIQKKTLKSRECLKLKYAENVILEDLV
jgi:ATP-dependent DNA helicase UvrD/PcrA